jgi:alkylation response protein AidB-like acyl-CoA dehydrogenase
MSETDSRAEFRNSARDFLSRSDHCKRVRVLRGAAPGFERSVWQAMAQAGWLSILVPEEQGGLGLGLAEVAAIAEEVGRSLLPEPFAGAGVQAVAALCLTPESALKTQLVDELTSGRVIAGFAWQERPGTLDTEKISLIAEEKGNEALLSGRKQFVVPGSGADGWIVSAAAAEGIALYWVPAATPGVSVSGEMRIDGTTMGSLTLERAAVPRSHRLASGEAAQAALAYANEAARIAQGAELLGVARRALEITLAYLTTRVQFGKPLGSFQALQHRVVDAYIQTELAAAGIREALAGVERGNVTLGAAASRIKARCAHAALLVTRLAIQFHGAIGYTDECDVGLYFKRALGLASWLGNAAQHRRRYFALLPRQTEKTEKTVFFGAFPRDTDWDRMPEAGFRQMVRAFLEQHYPQPLRYSTRRLHWGEIKAWYFTLSRQGWIAPAWPKAFGGMGLPRDKLLAFIEEMEQYGVARMPDQGLINLGPVLIRYGNSRQQERFLPKIISGEHVWCQGYSEPNAGSDLAALRTEALVDGDSFVVTGQKIWTTLAQDATHIFALVRTDKTVKKQAGISFLLVDLKTPGVTVRPILNITGDEEFCEVFFDRVRVPRENLVGEMNQGWTIAKALLGFERIFIGSPQQSQYALNQLERMAHTLGLFADSVFVERFAEAQLDVADLGAAYAHFADIVKRGETLPPNVSLLKIWATDTYSRIGMLLAETAGEHGGTAGDADFGAVKMNALAPLLHSAVTTIYAGTNEIQRNIIAKQVLDMPG